MLFGQEPSLNPSSILSLPAIRAGPSQSSADPFQSQGPVKVFVLQLRLLSFGVGMGAVRAGSGSEVQWSML